MSVWAPCFGVFPLLNAHSDTRRLSRQSSSGPAPAARPSQPLWPRLAAAILLSLAVIERPSGSAMPSCRRVFALHALITAALRRRNSVRMKQGPCRSCAHDCISFFPRQANHHSTLFLAPIFGEALEAKKASTEPSGADRAPWPAVVRFPALRLSTARCSFSPLSIYLVRRPDDVCTALIRHLLRADYGTFQLSGQSRGLTTHGPRAASRSAFHGRREPAPEDFWLPCGARSALALHRSSLPRAISRLSRARLALCSRFPSTAPVSFR